MTLDEDRYYNNFLLRWPMEKWVHGPGKTWKTWWNFYLLLCGHCVM